MSDLVSILEKVELAARRASKAPWTSRGDRALEVFARELAKIAKENVDQVLPNNAGEGEV